MLTQLHIKNFALIEQLTLEFSPRLTVLTGETGAGKSILIDALRFALGERMDSPGAGSEGKPALVEAVFELESRDPAALSDMYSEEGLLVLRREYAQARTRAWINNRLVPLSTLQEAGRRLIDIHGQYDHQLLLDSSSHLDLTDRLWNSGDLKSQYGVLYEQYRNLLREREELAALEENKERELDLLKYQIGEIERAEIEGIDEQELESESLRLTHAERLSEGVSRALAVLDENDSSVSVLLAEALRDLGGLSKLDGSLETAKGESEEIRLALENLTASLREYRDKLTFDPDRFAETEKKLDILQHLKRKYGGSFSKILEFYREAKDRLARLSDTEVTRKDLEKKIGGLRSRLEVLAAELSEKRKKTGGRLKKTVESELKDLQMPHGRFEVRVEKAEFSEEGFDRLEFLIQMNPGQPLLPLQKIISGGEASRVMLAMKKALMDVDPVPTLVFDEIDTNIGGRLGHVTGQKLKNISGQRQVLLVTHLPQIASFADRHIKVVKSAQKGKTEVRYEVLEGEGRVRELAEMMNGSRETVIAKRHAEEMLSQAT
jgi:DNA repair protein RecN (Recombination protein N)